MDNSMTMVLTRLNNLFVSAFSSIKRKRAAQWRVGCLLALLLLQTPPARAGIGIAGSVGIAGLYREGTWMPVTIALRGTGNGAIPGEAQAMATPDPPDTPAAQASLASSPPPVVYAIPAVINGSSTSEFRLYIRDIDPVSDDLTLQFVEGDDRGDGRVLARVQMTTTGSNAHTIGGAPVAGQDVWIVGLAGDPAAFSFLGGQRLGLVHTHGGAREKSTIQKKLNSTRVYSPYGNSIFPTPVAVPPSVQVSGAGIADLPDKAAGYSGVDAVVVRTDAPLNGLTEAQIDALRGWVATGGHLVITFGPDPSGFAAPALNGLLPATVDPVARGASFPTAAGGVGSVAAVGLAPKPYPGVRVLLAQGAGGSPLVVAGPYGAGTVTVAAFDPTTLAFRNWSGKAEERFWRAILTGGMSMPSSVLAYVEGREEADLSFPAYGIQNPQLSTCLLRTPSLDAPGTGTIALLLLAYIIVLVPVNYLVLKRIDRRELAWITIPCLVVVFATGTYTIGYASKGGNLFINRISIVETTAGSNTSGIYSAFGIFSPHRSNYDLAVYDPEVLVGQPNIERTYYGGMGQRGNTDGYAPVHLTETASECRLRDMSVNMWSMRSFDTASSSDLGGSVDAAFSWNPSVRQMQGTILNGTPYRLVHCWLCFRDQARSLGDLAPGMKLPASVVVSADAPAANKAITPLTVSLNQFPSNAFSDISPGGDYYSGDSDLNFRMQRGTVDFLRSLNGREGGDYWYGQSPRPTDEPDIPYAPRKDEAILAGWAEGTGPLDTRITIDGHAVTENRLTFIIVHIPMPGISK